MSGLHFYFRHLHVDVLAIQRVENSENVLEDVNSASSSTCTGFLRTNGFGYCTEEKPKAISLYLEGRVIFVNMHWLDLCLDRRKHYRIDRNNVVKTFDLRHNSYVVFLPKVASYASSPVAISSTSRSLDHAIVLLSTLCGIRGSSRTTLALICTREDEPIRRFWRPCSYQ